MHCFIINNLTFKTENIVDRHWRCCYMYQTTKIKTKYTSVYVLKLRFSSAHLLRAPTNIRFSKWTRNNTQKQHNLDIFSLLTNIHKTLTHKWCANDNAQKRVQLPTSLSASSILYTFQRKCPTFIQNKVTVNRHTIVIF